MRSLERDCAALLGVGLGLCSAQLAAREPLELSWQAPAECPSPDQAAAALQRLAAAGSELGAARVQIAQEEGRWRATLSTRGAERRLDGESCGAVVEALTVVLALAADQAEQAPLPSVTAEKMPDPPPARPAESPSVDGPVSPRRSPAYLRFALGFGVLAELGMLPGPSAGPRGALEFHHDDWSVELAFAALLPRHAELSGAGSPASDIYWLGGQIAACHVFVKSFSACLGGESGQLSGTGSGVDEPFEAHGWWFAGTGAVRLRGPLSERGALSWQLGVGAALALLRPEFGFDELGVLHRPSAVSGRLFLGFGWQ